MDPLLGASVAKVATEAGTEAAKTTSTLVGRVLGPAADEVGEWLARIARNRLNNVERIAEAAARKGATERAGEVNHRVAHKVLDEGSYFDGEIAAEYFGGMLAGSKTVDGRDDVAVTWASLVSTMSSAEIRLHFILYREWARLLFGCTDVNLAMDEGRYQAELHALFLELLTMLTPDDPSRLVTNFDHAVTGLHRMGLIGNYGYGARGASPQLQDSPYDPAFFAVPAAPGLELYGWAQGVGAISASSFTLRANPFEVESIASQLVNVAIPRLPDLGTVESPSAKTNNTDGD